MAGLAALLAAIAVSSSLAALPEDRCARPSWEKIVAAKPESLAGPRTVLYAALDSDGITEPCFERCARANCSAFVLDFARSVCYSVDPRSEELLPDPSAVLFRRVCVRVPASCSRDRLWQVERNPGAVFIDSGALRVPDPIRRTECYEKCVQAGGGCESAQFRATRPLSSDDTEGRCALSVHERGTRPRAYRASMYRDEYLRDQCRNLSRREYCSYAEFRNATLPYSDLALAGLDEDQCRRRCDASADGFVCRGYTVRESRPGRPVCLLHSEDTASLGVSSLLEAANATYREREACLNLKVRCDESAMTIELTTGEPFHGRMYAIGHADSCAVQGSGADRTVLRLPVPAAAEVAEGARLRCGLRPAFPVDDRNRSKPLLWATIVVQFNPVVQRLGDQAARVGCSLTDRAPPRPTDLTVRSSFGFVDPNAGVPAISSTIVNASSQPPTVVMRILDENSRDALVTHLGQKLVLRIQPSPADGPYDIAAGRLVASSASGDASYVLLDDNGCPTDPATFPALSRDPLEPRTLLAGFAAFKFPGSQLVRFDATVRFCAEKCPRPACGPGQPAPAKRKRSDREAPEDELALRLSIVVRDPALPASADRLSSRVPASADAILVTGPGTLDGLVCVDASLALGLLIFWLIVQIALIAGCLYAVARYRRTAIRAEEDRARVLARHLYAVHGGTYEIARRVRWASSLDR